MRKSMYSLIALSLLLPLLFFGCGSDGSTGATGATGAPGTPGTPGAAGPPGEGVVASETCVLCHGTGKTYDVAAMHATTPLVPITITGVAFTDNPDNVVNKIVAVSFNYAGVANLLDNSSSTQLSYPRFYLAKLVPGTAYPATGTAEPDVWVRTVSGERVHGNLASGGSGNYTYTFSYNVQAADVALTHRVGIYTTGVANEITRFATTDVVPNGAAVTVTRNIVTTAACQQCHDPLGGGDVVFHGGARNTAEACVLCHRTVQGARDNTVVNFNPETGLFEGTGAAYYPYMVHKIHGSHQRETSWIFHGKDYEEVTYPQDIRNCTTCHKGTEDGGDWKNKPSIVGCGSCHSNVNFTTGAGHLGGAQANNQFCGLCHTADLITGVHATENSTPNNPQLPAGLAKFEYFIDNVTVDSSNAAVVKFRITKNGTPINFKDNTALSGFTYGPSFLVAYANNVTNPQDYSNFGKSAGQPASVTLQSLLSSLTSTDNATFTATLASAPFPAGAKMRAVALQGYFSQTVGATSVGRHTPAVEMAVAGDKARRKIIKSGYNAAGQPEGCLECHEIFEGHGGNRVNNVQVCVMCHNPSLTSSARTFASAPTGPDENGDGVSDIVALFGSDPLAYPEVPNNFKDLIHGLHSRAERDPAYPFVDIRNRSNGVLVLGAEITWPGNLKNCNKCHIGNSYMPDAIPAGANFSTAKITTGDASETLAQINTVRGTVANSTDLVNSPIVSACGMCHNSDTARGHFVVNGGDVQATRVYAEKTPPALGPATLPAP